MHAAGLHRSQAGVLMFNPDPATLSIFAN